MNINERFIEQAEYLSNESFTEWSTPIHNENAIINKLILSGAKLITGPRGCGKTTLLLKVFNRLVSKHEGSSFPVYVNFKSSLKLEPLYKTNSNAPFWFYQWLLLKVHYGLHNTLSELGIVGLQTKLQKEIIEKQISELELGIINSSMYPSLSTKDLIDEIELILAKIGKNKCVLLLDDAGHAFSSEQQHDFFEFFKEIKTKTISPKAAVYPGVTSYSSSFHIGHDAEEIDVWQKPSVEGYIEFMHSVLRTRLGENYYTQLNKNPHLLNLLCYSAYGIPRALLNMVAVFFNESEEDEFSSNKNFNNKTVLEAIKNNFDNTYRIYDSLRFKLPMYVNFVSKGSEIFESIITTIKQFDKQASVNRQSSIIAIKRPISPAFTKVLGFFQYAGLLSAQGISSRGGKGVYELYEIHYSAIVDRNVFFSSRGINIENYCHAFENRPNHHYPRHTEKSLIGSDTSDSLFKLALPACTVCNTPRLSEESKFCSNCGNQLKNISVFDSIVSQGIEKLPITQKRANSIKDHSRLLTIKDILIDTDNKQLFKVPMIGPFWAKKIKNYAEEFIA